MWNKSHITWSVNCVINDLVGVGKFAVTHTKLCFPVVTLLPEDNAKVLKQLDSGCRSITNTYKTALVKKQNFDSFIDPKFNVINRFFVLLFKTAADRTSHWKHNKPTAKIKSYVMINGISSDER